MRKANTRFGGRTMKRTVMIHFHLSGLLRRFTASQQNFSAICERPENYQLSRSWAGGPPNPPQRPVTIRAKAFQN